MGEEEVQGQKGQGRRRVGVQEGQVRLQMGQEERQVRQDGQEQEGQEAHRLRELLQVLQEVVARDGDGGAMSSKTTAVLLPLALSSTARGGFEPRARVLNIHTK